MSMAEMVDAVPIRSLTAEWEAALGMPGALESAVVEQDGYDAFFARPDLEGLE